MDGMTAPATAKVPTFNGPLEAGLRAVTLLGAAYPRWFDLQRLVGFDYLLVHTGDIGGPKSLHPPSPLQSAELLVRRGLIERALLLMMGRQLIEREVSAEGIRYRAGESAATFLSSLQSEYLIALKNRAGWLIAELGDRSEQDFRAVIRKFFDQWVEEFQAAERSMGAE
jgi:hypothetical protein